MTVGDERVVHGAMFAAPLGGVGTSALGVLGVVAGPPAWITGTVAVGAYYVFTGSVAVAGFASIFE